MKTEIIRQRGESAASELAASLAATVDMLRGQVADRLDEIDTKDLRKRADKISDMVSAAVADAVVDGIDSVRERVRMKAKARRRMPVGMLLVGGALAGAGVAAYFLARRPEVRQRAVALPGDLKQRVASQVNGGVQESKLKQAVEQAIFGGQPDPPGQLQVDVEGRTVYLRGEAEDRGFVDRAIRQAQAVDGVAAVIDLVSA